MTNVLWKSKQHLKEASHHLYLIFMSVYEMFNISFLVLNVFHRVESKSCYPIGWLVSRPDDDDWAGMKRDHLSSFDGINCHLVSSCVRKKCQPSHTPLYDVIGGHLYIETNDVRWLCNGLQRPAAEIRAKIDGCKTILICDGLNLQRWPWVYINYKARSWVEWVAIF